MNPDERPDLVEMTDEQFDHHITKILSRELGPYGYARYLRTYRSGSGDYTRDRHKWQKGITVQQNRRENPA